MGKNCDDKIDIFASCFAKYFNEYEKISLVDNNVITTQNNEKYAFHIEPNCKNRECYIDISTGTDIEKPYMRVFLYYFPNPDFDHHWLTRYDNIKF